MIRLGIIEDNLTYRTALETFIKTVADLELVYAGMDLSGMNALLAAAPHVVIMDIDLGKDSGITGVRLIKAARPDVQVLMLTVFEDEEKIFNSIKAGAVGYLLKKDPPQKIIEAIRNVYNGEGAINGLVARKILEYIPKNAAAQKVPNLDAYNLTKREKEILQLLIDGLSYKEIAAACFISIDTINSHIRKIYSKLDIHSRSEIAARLR
jgi:two-component system, NarL family, response regulator LiaR